jgi:hypothetical protein
MCENAIFEAILKPVCNFWAEESMSRQENLMYVGLADSDHFDGKI